MIALVAVMLTVVIYFLCKMSGKNDVARPYWADRYHCKACGNL